MITLRNLAYSTSALVLGFLLIGGTAFANSDGASTKHVYGGSGDPTVSITANGTVLVRGAEVSSTASGSLEAKTVWSGATLSWSVDTDNDTSYLDASGDNVSRADIVVGDTISFSGTLDGSLSVDAEVVRVWSDDTNDDTRLTGTIVSVGSGSFVIESGNRRVTVDVDSSTDITLGKEDAALADLETGQKVTVVGSYDGDEFDASSVTGIALKARGWGGFMDIFKNWKLDWKH